MAAGPIKRKHLDLHRVGVFAMLTALYGSSFAQTAGVQKNGAQAGAAPAGGQSQPATTFHVNAHLAVADVVVTDRHGTLIHGLTASDFHVFENGQMQTIASFEEHTGGAGSAPTAATASLPPDTYSNATLDKRNYPLFVILFDSLNTAMSDQSFAQSELMSLVRGLPCGSRVAVFRLGSKLAMLQGFTEDTGDLVATVGSKKASPQLGMFFDDPNLGLGLNAPDLTVGMGGSAAAKGGNYSAAVSHTYSLEDASEAGIQSDLVVSETIRALKALGLYLSGFPGRKNLVWLAGGFPIDITPNTWSLGQESSRLAGSPDPFRVNRTYTIAVRDLAFLLQSGNIAVYPIDVRGLVGNGLFNPAMGGSGGARAAVLNAGQTLASFANSNGQTHEIMQTIAKETGGRAYYNTNDVKGSMMEAFNDGSNYYALSYVPNNQNWDGKFRKIHIQVDRRDAKAYYRSGYYAEEPDKLKRPFPSPDPSMKSAMLRGGPAVTDVTFQVHLTRDASPHVIPASGPTLKSRSEKPAPLLTGPVIHYTLEYKIPTSEIQFHTAQQGPSRCNLTFSAIAYDADGKMLNSNVGKFDTPIGQNVYAAMRRDALHIRTWMNLPLGSVYLRVGIHDLTTDKMGAFEIPLDVTANARASK